MAAGLYNHDETFTEAIDEALAHFTEPDYLRAMWFGTVSSGGSDFDHVLVAQPLLFSIGYALGRMVMAAGVQPVALLGHSVGELVAGVLAGVVPLADAAGSMQRHVEAIAHMAPGGMLTVAAGPDTVATYLHRHPEVEVAAVNAPRQVVVAGPTDALAKCREEMQRSGLTTLNVKASTAFHHSSVDAAIAGVRGVKDANLSPPTIAIWSAFLPGVLDAATATSGDHWRRHPSRPVYFWSALDGLLRSRALTLVELGVGEGLSTLSRQHPEVRKRRSAVRPLFPRGNDDKTDQSSTSACLEELVSSSTERGAP